MAGSRFKRGSPTLSFVPTTIHERIVDLRRHTNVHLLYGRRPIRPSNRRELWIKPDEGNERKLTVNTRTMPARRGHEVSLIVTTHKVPRVLGLANLSTIDGVNYARTDAPSLIRAWDIAILLAAFVGMAIHGGSAGMALFVPAALAYLLVAGFSRAVIGTLLTRRVDRVIDEEARRTGDDARMT